jgi:RNA polymerase-binding transcription factor DksA
MANMNPTRNTDHQAIRERLQRRADELRGELDSLRADRNDGMDATGRETVLDSGEQSEQISRDDVRRSEHDRDVNELREITAALQRIDEGSYGQCADCGVDITPSRLEVQPSALRCIKCQEKFEETQPRTTGGGARIA